MAHINCIVVTPEATALRTKARFVAVPLTDGEKGIGLGHAPLIGRLGAGELRLRTDDGTLRYFIDGGFVQVVNNEVSITTSRAIPATELASAVIQEQLSVARHKRTKGSHTLAERERVVDQLRAQLRVARRA
jgi:F-type H+-transporting ATPase subunit epsilon